MFRHFPRPLPRPFSPLLHLQVATMLRTLTHGRAPGDDSDIEPTQAMYSTILVILQASTGVTSVGCVGVVNVQWGGQT